MNPITYCLLWLLVFTILFIGALLILSVIASFFSWIKDQFNERKYKRYLRWKKAALKRDEFKSEYMASEERQQRVIVAKQNKKKERDLTAVRRLEFKTEKESK